MGVSRSKVENYICLALNAINIVVYCIVLSAALVKASDGTLGEIISSVYGAKANSVLSILLIVNEFKATNFAQFYFGFVAFHAGRGLLLIFLGCLVMSQALYNVIASIMTCTVGLAYLILSYIPAMPPPNAFAVHWQHHQDFCSEGLDLPPPPPKTRSMVQY